MRFKARTTRRGALLYTGLCTVALAFSLACHRSNKGPSSVINVADPATANQLLSGFYNVESNRWRWTNQDFSVALKPPPGGEQKGATLRLHLFIPDSQLKKLGPMTLSAELDGHPLGPETFSEEGSYIYARDIPGDALRSDLIPVTFSLDKAAPPSAQDSRELGAVVTSIELQSK